LNELTSIVDASVRHSVEMGQNIGRVLIPRVAGVDAIVHHAPVPAPVPVGGAVGGHAPAEGLAPGRARAVPRAAAAPPRQGITAVLASVPLPIVVLLLRRPLLPRFTAIVAPTQFVPPVVFPAKIRNHRNFNADSV